eukprot:scaffold26312_cov137-Cylindrotheca_fusiformis.AAC.2
MNGYCADISDNESVEDAKNEVIAGLKGNVGANSSNRLSHRRRRSLKRRAPGLCGGQEFMPSPIHPDIDISLTHCISSRAFDEKRYLGFPFFLAGSVAAFRQTKVHESPAIANIATNVRNESSENITAPVALNSIQTKQIKDGYSALLDEMNSSGRFQTEPESSKHVAGGPKVVSDTTVEERSAATIYSQQYRFLEEGIALTQTPRLLVEAESPHRVVHANTAFTRSAIGTSVNVQRWIERHSSPTIAQNRSLETALRDIVPDPEVHLTVYPVRGSEKVSHYLVEITEESNRTKRRRVHSEQASLTIG